LQIGELKRMTPGRKMTAKLEFAVPPSLADAVADLADRELLSMSAWCRRVIVREVAAASAVRQAETHVDG
jgi:hypothetical protein